ncbi:hypothetical protein BBJ28_00024940 [Nothophytophthora sp. Chile5]|nr:hypothetical protein BBJ28_00024940 [Nothophytophthora sp. Chile5]
MLPRMTFTKEDEQHYREISDDCLAEVLDKYEDYLYKGNRRINSRRWKMVKSRESVTVYRERSASDTDSLQGSSDRGVSSSSGSSSGVAYHARHAPGASIDGSMNGGSTVLGPGAALASGSKIPVMICTATMPGALEDAMYGTFVDDSASFRRRSTYEKYMCEDSAMLATFNQPTKQDPFQFMGLSWILRGFAGLGAVVKRRDFLLLHRTGMATTSRGERIGITVLQSVPHRDLPELAEFEIIRAKMSMCTIYRQMGDQVDVFVQVAVQPGGHALSYFMEQETASSIMCVAKPMDVSQKKKLFWLMRKNAHKAKLDASALESPGGQSNSSSSSSSLHRRVQRHESDHCAACKKSLKKLFSTGGSFCQICQQVRPPLSLSA